MAGAEGDQWFESKTKDLQTRIGNMTKDADDALIAMASVRAKFPLGLSPEDLSENARVIREQNRTMESAFWGRAERHATKNATKRYDYWVAERGPREIRPLFTQSDFPLCNPGVMKEKMTTWLASVTRGVPTDPFSDLYRDAMASPLSTCFEKLLENLGWPEEAVQYLYIALHTLSTIDTYEMDMWERALPATVANVLAARGDSDGEVHIGLLLADTLTLSSITRSLFFGKKSKKPQIKWEEGLKRFRELCDQSYVTRVNGTFITGDDPAGYKDVAAPESVLGPYFSVEWSKVKAPAHYVTVRAEAGINKVVSTTYETKEARAMGLRFVHQGPKVWVQVSPILLGTESVSLSEKVRLVPLLDPKEAANRQTSLERLGQNVARLLRPGNAAAAEAAAAAAPECSQQRWLCRMFKVLEAYGTKASPETFCLVHGHLVLGERVIRIAAQQLFPSAQSMGDVKRVMDYICHPDLTVHTMHYVRQRFDVAPHGVTDAFLLKLMLAARALEAGPTCLVRYHAESHDVVRRLAQLLPFRPAPVTCTTIDLIAHGTEVPVAEATHVWDGVGGDAAQVAPVQGVLVEGAEAVKRLHAAIPLSGHTVKEIIPQVVPFHYSVHTARQSVTSLWVAPGLFSLDECLVNGITSGPGKKPLCYAVQQVIQDMYPDADATMVVLPDATTPSVAHVIFPGVATLREMTKDILHAALARVTLSLCKNLPSKAFIPTAKADTLLNLTSICRCGDPHAQTRTLPYCHLDWACDFSHALAWSRVHSFPAAADKSPQQMSGSELLDLVTIRRYASAPATDVVMPQGCVVPVTE